MAKSQKQLNKGKGFKRIDFRERVIIENRYCVDSRSVERIADELKRPVCTIVRELAGKPRKGRGRYMAHVAQAESLEKRKEQGRKSRFEYQPLKEYVVGKLKLGWSPEQISIRLPIDFSNNQKMRVSHEAIYQHVYSRVYRSGNGTLKAGEEDLRQYLPRRHNRRTKKGFRKAQKLEKTSSLPSIEIRPKEVETREVLGHWEGDTLVSRESKARIKSLNELVSGVSFFSRTKDGTATECDKVVLDRLSRIPSPYRKTLTQDRGSENLEWKTLEQELGIDCFFAHPYCSHERGSNENTNGLFRRYFPKGTDFGKITDLEVAKVEYLLNTRPRKRLAGFTPYEVFYQITGVALDC
jgi:IS30 family transposase